MFNTHLTIRLIEEVFGREPLWNSHHRLHQNRTITRGLWKEISRELNIPADRAIARWKGLRDTLRRVIRKHPLPQADTPALEIRSKWFYYKHLLFLKGHIRSSHIEDDVNGHYPSENNVEVSSADDVELPNDGVLTTQWNSTKQEIQSVESEEVKSNCAVGDISILDDTPSQNIDNTFVRKNRGQLRRGKQKRNEDSDVDETDMQRLRNAASDDGTADQNDAMMKQKVANLPAIAPRLPALVDADDDWYFFQSLLPTVKSLPAEKKFLLRMQIQELVYRAVFSNSHQSLTITNLGTEDSDSTVTR